MQCVHGAGNMAREGVLKLGLGLVSNPSVPAGIRRGIISYGASLRVEQVTDSIERTEIKRQAAMTQYRIAQQEFIEQCDTFKRVFEKITKKTFADYKSSIEIKNECSKRNKLSQALLSIIAFYKDELVPKKEAIEQFRQSITKKKKIRSKFQTLCTPKEEDEMDNLIDAFYKAALVDDIVAESTKSGGGTIGMGEQSAAEMAFNQRVDARKASGSGTRVDNSDFDDDILSKIFGFGSGDASSSSSSSLVIYEDEEDEELDEIILNTSNKRLLSDDF